MPLFEFECKKCGVIEILVNSSGSFPTKCDCGKKLRKLISRHTVGLTAAGTSFINSDRTSTLGGDFIGDGNFSISPSR